VPVLVPVPETPWPAWIPLRLPFWWRSETGRGLLEGDRTHRKRIIGGCPGDYRNNACLKTFLFLFVLSYLWCCCLARDAIDKEREEDLFIKPKNEGRKRVFDSGKMSVVVVIVVVVVVVYRKSVCK
jgi:hypothetical protein